jgi:hypothetical protein
MLKPKRPEIGNWKLNVAKNQGSVPEAKATFYMLLDKYSKQKAVTSDQPLKKKDKGTHTSREAFIASQGSYKVQGRIISAKKALYSG